ncbi:MAG: PEP-CTERM sorting domain-containing protein [Planctomycetota bacterium]
MSTTLRAATLFVAATLALPSSYLAAATLNPISPPSDTKLFTTEIKRDEEVDGPQRGHDAFIVNAGDSSVNSAPFNWGASGTTYDWSVAYDGNTATLGFSGGISLPLDIDPDGVWNAIKIITRSNDTTNFSAAKVTVVVEDANGSPLDAPQSFMAELDQFNEVTLALSDGSNFTSLAGTITWDFTPAPGAGGTPNSRYAFNLKALTAIPEPGTFGLALASLAGLAVRRQRALVG